MHANTRAAEGPSICRHGNALAKGAAVCICMYLAPGMTPAAQWLGVFSPVCVPFQAKKRDRTITTNCCVYSRRCHVSRLSQLSVSPCKPVLRIPLATVKGGGSVLALSGKRWVIKPLSLRAWRVENEGTLCHYVQNRLLIKMDYDILYGN